jgi:hypothetical protein
VRDELRSEARAGDLKDLELILRRLRSRHRLCRAGRLGASPAKHL